MSIENGYTKGTGHPRGTGPKTPAELFCFLAGCGEHLGLCMLVSSGHPRCVKLQVLGGQCGLCHLNISSYPAAGSSGSALVMSLSQGNFDLCQQQGGPCCLQGLQCAGGQPRAFLTWQLRRVPAAFPAGHLLRCSLCLMLKDRLAREWNQRCLYPVFLDATSWTPFLSLATSLLFFRAWQSTRWPFSHDASLQTLLCSLGAWSGVSGLGRKLHTSSNFMKIYELLFWL